MPAPLPRLAPTGALLLAALLAGCGSGNENKFAPVCPRLSLLQDAADITRFAGPGPAHDARTLVLTGSITAVPAKCQNGEEKNTVQATLHVIASLHRGPAAQGDAAQLPYFIALTENGHVLSEQDFTLSGQFRPNVDTVRAEGDDIGLAVQVSKTKSAAAYHIYVGFRLTAEELAYNRQAQR
jgi:hypothetical protein